MMIKAHTTGFEIAGAASLQRSLQADLDEVQRAPDVGQGVLDRGSGVCC